MFEWYNWISAIGEMMFGLELLSLVGVGLVSKRHDATTIACIEKLSGVS